MLLIEVCLELNALLGSCSCCSLCLPVEMLAAEFKHLVWTWKFIRHMLQLALKVRCDIYSYVR